MQILYVLEAGLVQIAYDVGQNDVLRIKPVSRCCVHGRVDLFM
jgi:hypothetical protein